MTNGLPKEAVFLTQKYRPVRRRTRRFVLFEKGRVLDPVFLDISLDDKIDHAAGGAGFQTGNLFDLLLYRGRDLSNLLWGR